jgi:hypothetical protein
MNFLIEKFFDTGNDKVFFFETGYVIGVFFALCLVLLLKILLILIFNRYPRRAKGISIEGENGSLFIGSGAISDLTLSVGKGFDFMKITRVVLLQKKKCFALDITVVYDIEGGSLQTILSDLKSELFLKLQEVFGIDCIMEINFHNRKLTSGKTNTPLKRISS